MLKSKAGDHCIRCERAWFNEGMPGDAMQPLRGGAMDSRSVPNEDCDYKGPQCRDCQAAETLMRVQGLTWHQARIAVASCRQEQLRLPGAHAGLVGAGFMQPNEEGDFERHLEWLEEHFGSRCP